jgi:nucleoside-diphosphate-sugar epimerase
VLVTGGTGFIGSHLVRRLVSGGEGVEGRKVRVLCRESSNLDRLPNQGVELAFGDVSRPDTVREAMRGIEVVYHLAATMGGDWAEHQRGTIDGTQTVLEAAAEARVKKVVYMSSLGVLCASRFPGGLGAARRPIDESFRYEERPEARGDYSRAKLEAERIALRYAESRLDLCIVRPGLVYGRGNDAFLSDAGFKASKRLVLAIGLGGRRLGLSYVENLVDALVLAERRSDTRGRVYHIVDPDQPTVRQYIQAYRRLSGARLTALYLPTALWRTGFGLLDVALGVVRGRSPNLGYRLRSIARGPRYDLSAAMDELGWKPRYSFEEAMRITLDGAAPNETAPPSTRRAASPVEA